MEFAGQQRPSTIAAVPDPLLGPAEPGNDRRAHGVGQEQGYIELLLAHFADQRPMAGVGRFAARVEVPLFIKPVGAAQHVRQVGTHDANQPSARAEVATHCP